MKQVKTGNGFSRWLLRLSLAVYLVAYNYSTLGFLDFLDVTFVFALVYVIGAVTLLIGGFSKTNTVTTYASLILLVAVGFNVYIDISDGFYGVINHVLPLGIAFFFLLNGNK